MQGLRSQGCERSVLQLKSDHTRVRHVLKYGCVHAVAQLVEAQRYKPESRGFDSGCCHWDILLAVSFRPHCGPGVTETLTEMSTRVSRLTVSPPSCADCLDVLGTSEPVQSGPSLGGL